jgi:hypothetical protein
MAQILQERTHVDEPQQLQEYVDVVSQAASQKKTVVLHRDGTELAAIVPLEYLEELEDALAMAEAQRILKTLDLPKLARENPPPQEWFDRDEPKPF